MEVSEGFEPSVSYEPTLVFKTSLVNHLSNSPYNGDTNGGRTRNLPPDKRVLYPVEL